jgi:hypothetical protein
MPCRLAIFLAVFHLLRIQPMLRQWILGAMRVRNISQIESERKSRVILLVRWRRCGFLVSNRAIH